MRQPFGEKALDLVFCAVENSPPQGVLDERAKIGARHSHGAIGTENLFEMTIAEKNSVLPNHAGRILAAWSPRR